VGFNTYTVYSIHGEDLWMKRRTRNDDCISLKSSNGTVACMEHIFDLRASKTTKFCYERWDKSSCCFSRNRGCQQLLILKLFLRCHTFMCQYNAVSQKRLVQCKWSIFKLFRWFHNKKGEGWKRWRDLSRQISLS